MPYGIAKEAGGDSPANDAKMHMCIKEVMAKGATEESAIRICKASIQKHAMKGKQDVATPAEPASR